MLTIAPGVSAAAELDTIPVATRLTMMATENESFLILEVPFEKAEFIAAGNCHLGLSNNTTFWLTEIPPLGE